MKAGFSRAAFAALLAAAAAASAGELRVVRPEACASTASAAAADAAPVEELIVYGTRSTVRLERPDFDEQLKALRAALEQSLEAELATFRAAQPTVAVSAARPDGV